MTRIGPILRDTLAQLHAADGRELPPHYAPPYESPIEQVFAREGQHHWRPDVRVVAQVPVATRLGSFRLDFMVTAADGWRIGVECDGAAYHDTFRDAFRDAAILGGRSVDSIVRIRGTDLVTRPWDIFYAFGMAFPRAFSSRGHELARRRVSRPAWEQVPAGWGRLTIRYLDLTISGDESTEPVEDPSDVVVATDRGGEVELRHRGRGQHGLTGWQKRYARILAHPTRSIDEWTRQTIEARQRAWALRYPVP